MKDILINDGKDFNWLFLEDSEELPENGVLANRKIYESNEGYRKITNDRLLDKSKAFKETEYSLSDTNLNQSYPSGVIICSGGLDSTTLMYYLHDKGVKLKAISFDYGQRHKIELKWAKYHTQKLGIPHTIVDLSGIFQHVSHASALLGGMDVPTLEEVVGDPQPITYVPFRNMLMLTVAAAIAENTEGEAVYYGAQKHDEYSGYWDTTQEFTNKLQQVFNQNRKVKIQVLAPFVDKSKSDLVKIGTELGVEYEKTMTCYNGNDCGTCPTCKDRIRAFERVGLTDPKFYPKQIEVRID